VKRHQELLTAAIERDGQAQRTLFAQGADAARVTFVEAAELYRSSWEAAPPGSYGRLVGMLKSAVLGGGGEAQADYVRAQLGDEGAGSPTASYAHALAALISRDDGAARRWGEGMRGGGGAFARTARAIDALASDDREGYAAALEEIVSDFEARADHLTGVAVADTALMLQELARRRGMAAELASNVLPAA
jgi:hypothetical protein